MNKDNVSDFLPNFFRVLIIDDKVTNDPELFVPLRAVLKGIVEKLWKIDHKNDPGPITEILFENHPVEGFERWCNEVFDLVLIDRDFSDNLDENEESITNVIIHSKNQGETIWNMMDKAIQNGGLFSYRFHQKRAVIFETDKKRKKEKSKIKLLLWSGEDESKGI